MKLSFSTLGCPGWDLETILCNGRAMGFDGVDFRGLGDELDITTLPAFTAGLSATARRIADAGLAVSAISSGIRLCDEHVYSENVAEAERTIPVARALGANVVRVFGGGDPDGRPRQVLVSVARQCMNDIAEKDGATELIWALETHDKWITADLSTMLTEAIPEPWFGIVWDIGHTPRLGDEPPAETVAALGDRICYLHVKDAVHEASHPQAMADGWRYVAPGEGELPLAEAVKLMRGRGYDGWLTLEHEKRWHPELSEPEELFPRFVRWARRTAG